ncbi:hypothetical protein M422DRAFT_782997 [Sphaerobolus stellatus SS14]|uniref:Uncharacterized protein n=1 Tax=Sphaerobolus stellatus (strain SS14) TaxID=990650 RepID=A0A0C9TUP3_SPHS4|nr:hypothetical protein M422DRAFT_782997 [Sphaerobolus stellatus SS14]
MVSKGPLVPLPQNPAEKTRWPTVPKELRKERAKKGAETEEEINAELVRIRAWMDNDIHKLATKYNKKARYFEERLSLASQKQQRAPTAYNVYMHLVAKKENANLPLGERSNVVDLVRSGTKDYAALTQEQKDELLQALIAYRATKKQGRRRTTKSQSKDLSSCMKKLQQMMNDMDSRCGVSSFIFIDFVKLAMKVDVCDIGSRYEGYMLNNLGGAAHNYKKRKGDLRDSCSNKVAEGLRLATGQNKLHMVYTPGGYARIVFMYGYVLRGWPLKEFKAPTTIGSIHELQTLELALEAGECRWEEATQEDLDRYAGVQSAEGKARAEKRANANKKDTAAVAGAKRKARSKAVDKLPNKRPRRFIASSQFVQSDDSEDDNEDDSEDFDDEEENSESEDEERQQQ